MTDPAEPPRDHPRFHLAIPVDDLDAATAFYGGTLGCPRGRSSDDWADWDLFGHQLVTHRVKRPNALDHNPVDGEEVPVPHFGVILDVAEFGGARRSPAVRAETSFVIEPYVRFAGGVGEQWTMFLFDPAGNALEFKAFADDAGVFAHREMG